MLIFHSFRSGYSVWLEISMGEHLCIWWIFMISNKSAVYYMYAMQCGCGSRSANILLNFSAIRENFLPPRFPVYGIS